MEWGRVRYSSVISLNKAAAEIVERMTAKAEQLGLAVSRLSNGAQIVDAGVDVPGSLNAGRLFSEACMGGLGDVQFRMLSLGGLTLPGVEVNVEQPMLACMAAQYAGWEVDFPGSAESEAVSYTHLRAHETVLDLVCRLLLEKKKKKIPR